MSEQSTQKPYNVEDFRKKNKEVKNRGKLLIQQGHKCVKFLETFPARLIWCGEESCKNK